MSKPDWLNVEYQKVRQFAWWPQRVSNGRWVWLKHYWIKVPVHPDQ